MTAFIRKQFAWLINRLPRITVNSKSLLLIGIITGSFLALFLLTEVLLPVPFRTWNSQINDGFFRLRHELTGKRKMSPYLVHAVINDSSFRTLDLTYGDRSIYGRVLDTLREAGVTAVACDIFFSDNFYPENDEPLIRATSKFREAGGAIYYPVILQPFYYAAAEDSAQPAGLGAEAAPETTASRAGAALIAKNLWYPKILNTGRPLAARLAVLPFLELAKQASGLAHITCEPDEDGINRRFPLLYRYKDGYLPALTFRLLCDYLKVNPAEIEVVFGKYIRLPGVRLGEYPAQDIVIPIDEQARMIINFAGSWEESFIHFPIHNLLQAEEDRELQIQLYDDFEGSLVVFSDISTRHKDFGPGIFDKAYPLSGLHLNLANTILTRDFMHEPGWPENLLTGLCMILLLWFFASRLRPLSFLLASLALYLGYFFFNLTGFIVFNRVTQMLPLSLAFVCSLLLISFYRFIIEEQEKQVFKARAQAKEQLERINRELNSANLKLKELDAYKTHFVQNITHEFRTPLTLIIGPLRSLLSSGYEQLPAAVKKLLPMIQLSAQKLLHLVDDLLDLSRLESGKTQLAVQLCDLCTLLAVLTDYFKPLAAGKGVALHFKSTEKSLPVYLDQEKLEKILFNLLSNAFKFTPGGGSITVGLSSPVPVSQAPLKRSWPRVPPRQLVKITVSDTGVGIPPAEVEEIFTRFGQAKAARAGGYGGTGIGLALVKEYADLHYGEVQVNSEPGHGTEFSLWLPLDKEVYKADELAPPAKETGTAATGLSRLFTDEVGFIIPGEESVTTAEESITGQQVTAASASRKKAILLAEDDPAMREYIKHILGDNYLLYEAGDGRTALQMAREHKPELVLSDLLMPIMNGQELLAALRAQTETCSIPFILITATGKDAYRQQRQAPAPDDYLNKPFSPEELLARVKNCLLSASYQQQYLVAGKQDRLFSPFRAASPGLPSPSHGTKAESAHERKPRFPKDPVLIVDDDPQLLTCYQETLGAQGFTNLLLCADSRQVMPLLLKKRVTAVLLDLSLPYISGEELLREIKKEFPSTAVIMVTGVQMLEAAVACMKNGAYDYLVKPVEINRLVSLLHHCIEQKTLEGELDLLRNKLQVNELKDPEAFSGIITQHAAMQDLFRLAESFAPGTKPVLITGESGTGKELFANVLHRLSRRPGKYIKENIAGLDNTIFSDTLFGHARGAFTGALEARKGLVEEAEGGTLFLDEIGELDPDAQVKLLRLLEYGEYRQLGSDKIKQADVRIIVATNADLTARIKAGTFRKDLYYRLAYKLHIPPLRERLTDIPLLVEHFWKKAAAACTKPLPLPAAEVIGLLQSYHYPGNIRELELMIDSAVSLAGQPEQYQAYFREYILQHASASALLAKPVSSSLSTLEHWLGSSTKFPSLEEVEELVIREAMKKSRGNQRLAAGLLGLSPSALNRRLNKGKTRSV